MVVDEAVVAGGPAAGAEVEVGEITVGLDARAVEEVVEAEVVVEDIIAIEWKERRQHRDRTIVGIRGDLIGLLGCQGSNATVDAGGGD